MFNMRRLTLSLLSLAWPAAGWADDVPVTSSVDAVTVFPQGAEVSRVAKVKVEKGMHTVVISDVPADVDPSSIRVEGLATGKLEIGSVDSRRLMVPSTDVAVATSERRRIEDDIQILRDQRSSAEAQLQAAETQKNLISNLSQLPTRPAPGQGAERTEDWSQILTTIATGSLEAHSRTRVLNPPQYMRLASKGSLRGSIISLSRGSCMTRALMRSRSRRDL
jgi:hypothetical protein